MGGLSTGEMHLINGVLFGFLLQIVGRGVTQHWQTDPIYNPGNVTGQLPEWIIVRNQCEARQKSLLTTGRPTLQLCSE